MFEEDPPNRLGDARAIAVGGAPLDTNATLAIYADDLDPEYVSRVLKCRPTTARRKGERWPDRPRIQPACIGQWFLEAPSELGFAEQLAFLLNSTTESVANWRLLAESHRIELRNAIFLRSWTEGFELSNSVLCRIAERGWSFGLSMYSADGDEIVEAFLSRGSHGVA